MIERVSRRQRLHHGASLLAIVPVLAAVFSVGSAPRAVEAASPGSGTISDSAPTVTWTGQVYPVSVVAVPDQCPPAADPANVLCDHYLLTVTVPESYWDTHTGGAQVQITWTDPSNDFDLFVYDNAGNQVAQSASSGTTSEQTLIVNPNSAAGPYEIRVVPFLVVASGYSGSATFDSATGGTTNPPRSTGGLAFGPATVVDAQRTEGEPINHIDKSGAYWESGPWGTSTQLSFIHRSVDGGDQFNIVSGNGLRPDTPPGGGDTDVITDDQGTAYFTDLEALINLDCAVSHDQGNTWVANHACVQNAAVDRQWFAVDNGPTGAATDNTIFLGTRDELGTFIYSSAGSTGPADPIGGLVFTDSSSTLTPQNGDVRCGKMVFDPVMRNLYYPCAGTDHASVTIGHVSPGQRTGIVYHNVNLPVSPGGGGVDDLFPLLAVDKAGTVYGAWIDTNDHNVYYTVSTDQGQTWAAPVHVNGNDANSNVMPWAVAGAPGTLAIGWYGSPSHQDSDTMPSWYNDRNAAAAFPWYGYMSVIRSAASATPTFVQARFTEKPMHYGQICTGGIGCTISNGDRTMADYFSFTLDRDGAIRVVYNDTTSQHHGAHLFEERQLAGPNAGTGGSVSKAAPKNPMADPVGDAQSPHYGLNGAGASPPQLDFTQVKLSQPNAATLRVEMSLASLASLAPPSGKTSAFWLTRFQALSVGDENEPTYRLFYVGAESSNGAAPTFFAGSGVSSNGVAPGNGCITNTPENCKVVLYPKEEIATGSVVGKVLRIDVPLAGGFGANRPIFGDTLYNVTGLSGGWLNPSDVYADLDATRAFDFKLGTVTPPPPPGPGAGRNVTGGGSITGSAGGDARFTLNVFANLKGKVDYRDGATVSFRTTRILDVTFDDTTHSVQIRGTGVDGNKQVTFTVVAVDNGEPGTTDTFSISLSDGYTRSGTLTRGNVQIH
jgi:hypothetical protein